MSKFSYSKYLKIEWTGDFSCNSVVKNTLRYICINKKKLKN